MERFYIDRRDTEIRGLLTPRRIVKVLDGTDAYHIVSFRRERRLRASYGPICCWTAAAFHKRFVIIVPKKPAPASTAKSAVIPSSRSIARGSANK